MHRKATLDDLEELLEVVNSAYKLELGDSGVAFKTFDRYVDLEHAKEDLEYTHVGKEESGKIVGVICIKLIGDLYADCGPIAVHIDKQGFGFGRRLLNFAKEKHPDRILQVEVVSTRTDLFPFYEKFGFKEEERFPFPIEDYLATGRPGNVTREGLELVVMRRRKN